MSDNPMLRIAGLASEISSNNLKAIADLQNKRYDRKLKREQLEQKAMDADRRYRLQEENSESLRESRARSAYYQDESFKLRIQEYNRGSISKSIDSQKEALEAQLNDLEFSAAIREVNGEDVSDVKIKADSLRSRIAELDAQKAQVYSESTITPSQSPAYNDPPRSAGEYYEPQQSSGLELPSGDGGGASGALFEGTRFDFSRKGGEYAPATDAGAAIHQHAINMVGKDYKKGESARCADFVCSVLEGSGYSLGDKRSDLVHDLNNDNIGQAVTRSELKPGDLVIFKNTYAAEHDYPETHVGIYAPQDGVPGFIHRPTKKLPVEWTSMEEGTFHSDRFMNGRRILGSNPGFFGDLTAYSPQADGNSRQGTYASAIPGPDGKAEVRTLEDFLSGKSSYITIAGDEKFFGRKYTIPSINYKSANGATYTLHDVPAVVHDTGEAFKGAPEGRFDISVAKDMPEKFRNDNHALWAKDRVQFIPEGATKETKTYMNEPKFFGPAAEETQLRAEPLEPQLVEEPQIEYEANVDFGMGQADDRVRDESVSNFIQARDDFSVTFTKPSELEFEDSGDLILSQYSMGDLQMPTAPSVRSADQLRDMVAKWDIQFGGTTDGKRKVDQLVAALSNKVQRDSPEVFDSMIAQAADKTIAAGGSRTDFEKQIPDTVNRLGLGFRAMEIFSKREGAKESRNRINEGIKELDEEIEKMTASSFDLGINMAKAQEGRNKATYEAYKDKQEFDAQRLQMLMSNRNRLIMQRDEMDGYYFDERIKAAQDFAKNMTLGKPEPEPSSIEAAEDEFLKKGLNGSALTMHPKMGQILNGLSELGIDPNMLQDAPLLSIKNQNIDGTSDLRERRALHQYVAKAYFEQSIKDFNELGQSEQDIFSRKSLEDIDSVRRLGSRYMEKLLKLYRDSGVVADLGLSENDYKNYPDKVKRAIYKKIESDPALRFALIKMERNGIVDKAKELIDSTVVQSRIAQEEKEQKTYELLLDSSK